MNISDLLHDAVDDVEPADRIADIRARTANPQQAAARPWLYAAGGVVLATAAAVTAFAVVGNDTPADGGDHDHQDQHVATDPMDTQLVPAYFVGDAPRGEARLYREFDVVPAGDALQAALDRIQRPASDPDYRTTWQHGSFESATLGDGTIDVELGDAGLPAPEGIAAQQLVYTLQGALGERLPIQFLDDGEPVGPRYEAVPENDVLNLVSISDPSEGYAYSGSMVARGRANSFEATVPWELRDEDGEVVLSGSATANGSVDRLYPWQVEIDLTGVPFGFYTFVTMTDDPSNGEGGGPFTDTRLITVR